MNTKILLTPAYALSVAFVLSACNAPPATATATPTTAAESATPAASSALPSTLKTDTAPSATVPSTLPKVLVHKSPSCGCCGAWVDHMRQAGFEVVVDETDDLDSIRNKLGVPHTKNSCHTAEVGGYVVEGHVPAEDVKRMLSEKPKARGLVLPGMPMGSPGMESPDGKVTPYTVELVGMNGATTPYARHGD